MRPYTDKPWAPRPPGHVADLGPALRTQHWRQGRIVQLLNVGPSRVIVVLAHFDVTILDLLNLRARAPSVWSQQKPASWGSDLGLDPLAFGARWRFEQWPHIHRFVFLEYVQIGLLVGGVAPKLGNPRGLHGIVDVNPVQAPDRGVSHATDL